MSKISDGSSAKSKFICPECGFDEVAELSVCVVSHPVTKWTDSGEPRDYGRAEVDWESDYPYSDIYGDETTARTLECRNCGAQFDKPTVANQPPRDRRPLSERNETQRRYGCPNCLSEEIVEQASVPVERAGEFFTDNTGKPQFSRYGSSAAVRWDSEQPEKLPYRCRDCSHQFREPVVITAAAIKARLARNRDRLPRP